MRALERLKAATKPGERSVHREGQLLAVIWWEGSQQVVGRVRCSSTAVARRAHDSLRAGTGPCPPGASPKAQAWAAVRYAEAVVEAARLRMWGARL